MLETIGRLGKARASSLLPLELVQLDDGWQSHWGDWLTPHPTRFPNGLRPISDAAAKAGMKAGLWIAPAALTSNSRLFAERPEWVLRTPSGKPLKCGWTAPGLWIYALDVTHPGALSYVRSVVRTAVHEWGFRYLKLDFLHTAAMPGAKRHDPTIGRGEALRRLMAAVRQEVGEDVFVLACGAPLAPCIGHVDGMRVSADAATHWLPTGIDLPGTRWLFASDRTNLPAARNMVRNVAVRMPMGGRWWRNDPDCLILRESASFTLGEAQALATVAALSAGALIFSDPPEALPPRRLAILQALVPPLPRAGVPVDLLQSEIPCQLVTPLWPADAAGGSGELTRELGMWLLVGLFNWQAANAVAGGEARLSIARLLAIAKAAAGRGITAGAEAPTAMAWPPADEGEGGGEHGEWHMFEFWSRTYTRIANGSEFAPSAIAPRCGALVSLRPVRQGAAVQLVGTNVHISCGLEVARWQVDSEGTLHFQLRSACAIETPCAWVYWAGSVEHAPPSVGCGSSSTQTCTWVGDGVWKIDLEPITQGHGDKAPEWAYVCRRNPKWGKI